MSNSLNLIKVSNFEISTIYGKVFTANNYNQKVIKDWQISDGVTDYYYLLDNNNPVTLIILMFREGQYELFIRTAYAYQNRGYATRALELLLAEHCINNSLITAQVISEHARRVVNKCKFKHTKKNIYERRK